ncbi:MAG: hypothetical protein LBP58_00105 [Azoarcus sp.]|jgi:hypothetical protein|nr:hypothetical protein [Azoarcus sp.]
MSDISAMAEKADLNSLKITAIVDCHGPSGLAMTGMEGIAMPKILPPLRDLSKNRSKPP